MERHAARRRCDASSNRNRFNALAAALAIYALGCVGAIHAQEGGSPRRTKHAVDEANPLVGTAPLDRQELIGNAPPPGEPLYSGITSPGARLPHSATEAAPVNVNLELSYPTGVPTPYHYPNPTMIGFTGGGGPSYGGRAEPIIMPVWATGPSRRSIPHPGTTRRARPRRLDTIRFISTRSAPAPN